MKKLLYKIKSIISRHIVLSIILAAIVLISGTCIYDAVDEKLYQNGSTIVYITNTGEKYHRGNCSYLRCSRRVISLVDAVQKGYDACLRCTPPKLIK